MIMKSIESIAVTINCKMSVDRQTAEGCLKLVEMFLNDNANFSIMSVDNDDGTESLYLVDAEGREAKT